MEREREKAHPFLELHDVYEHSPSSDVEQLVKEVPVLIVSQRAVRDECSGDGTSILIRRA